MDKQKQQEAYKNYVKQKTPVHNLPFNMFKAFTAKALSMAQRGGLLQKKKNHLQTSLKRKRQAKRSSRQNQSHHLKRTTISCLRRKTECH